MKFKYIGTEVSGYGDIEIEVRQQTAKAMTVAGCLNDTIWKNKHIGLDTKSKLHKTIQDCRHTITAQHKPEVAGNKRDESST